MTPGKLCLTLQPLLYGSPLHTAALIGGTPLHPHPTLLDNLQDATHENWVYNTDIILLLQSTYEVTS